jgi:DNA repair ATPase RecN
MLTRLRVRGFQSIEDADLDLGWFNVITGPSSSGKSAMVRALELLAKNRRGAEFIRRGAKTCTVEVEAGDETLVKAGITRSPGRAGDAYSLSWLQPVPDGGPAFPMETKFTKLGGEVPPQVLAHLRISDVNFARQIDPPFLLAESGRTVAQVLGDLTNVSLVFSAAAETGKAEKNHAAAARAAKQDAEELEGQARQYEDLPAERAALEAAEAALGRAEETRARLTRLSSLTGVIEQRSQAVTEAQAVQDRLEPPDPAVLDGMLTRYTRATQLYGQLTGSMAEARQFAQRLEAAEREEADAEAALHAVLVKAGTCPTCGSRISADSGGHDPSGAHG